MFSFFNDIKYREPLFRPPSEADSLIFQISYGCPHNKCLFCPMYKGVKYGVRPVEEVTCEIEKASLRRQDVARIFLADGDVMNLDFDYLQKILKTLNNCFPKLARVSVYANGSSILSKSSSQLEGLKELKLHTLYMGLESGDENVLNLVKKGETAKEMTQAVILAQNAGLRMCVFALLGIGGKKYTKKHAENTAKVVNAMAPRFFAALRFIQVAGTIMYQGYEPLSEYESIIELRDIIGNLELQGTVFRANHTSVPIPISARFPKGKTELLNQLELLLNSSELDKKSSGFVPTSL